MPAQICQRPIIVGRIGKWNLALIADPEATKTVLTGGEGSFPKWRIYEQIVGTRAGHEGLSTASGARWRRQRRIFGSLFRPDGMASLVPMICDATERRVAEWRARGGGARIDASLEMTRITLDVIWRLLFDADGVAESRVENAAAAIHAAQLGNDAKAAAQAIGELTDYAWRHRLANGAIADNPFIGLGASPVGRSGQRLTQPELIDNARSFLHAGHKTTALTLTWALWLIGREVDTQRRIHGEIDRIVGRRRIESGDIDNLVFTRQVLNETMRLFPPAPVTVRQSTAAVELAGERLPAGTVLIVCIYALHRHQQWWTEPDLFIPDRFAAGSGEPRHRFAFLPFSGGRHACIGAALGWTEAVATLATILQNFHVTSDRETPVKLRAAISLGPDREVPIMLHRRS